METLVFRQVAFPVSAFDYLKDFQRAYAARYGVRLTNSEALTIIITEYKQASAITGAVTVESEEHDAVGSQAGD